MIDERQVFVIKRQKYNLIFLYKQMNDILDVTLDLHALIVY